jgi:hypothetical protein
MAQSRILVPKALSVRGPWDLLKLGSDLPLFFRLAAHEQDGDKTLDPLTAPEIARLVEAFKDEPLPPPLRRLVVLSLTGRMKRRAGRKPKQLTARQFIQAHVLPYIYDEAFAEAKREVFERKALTRTRRRAPIDKSLGTASEIALQRVRAAIPMYKPLSDRALLNLISKTRREQADTGKPE